MSINTLYLGANGESVTIKKLYAGLNGQSVLIFDNTKTYNWTTSSDADIVEAISKLDAGQITVSELGWAVGDERLVSLNALSAGTYNVAQKAQNIHLVIYEVGAYNGTGHFIVGFKECLFSNEKMEDTNTNANGWHNSRGRKACDAIFNMIPSGISSIFKTFDVYTATKGGTGNNGVTKRSGKLALPAEKEVVGVVESHRSTQDELDSIYVHSQFAYFKTHYNRFKTKVSNSAGIYQWFLRSPYNSNTTQFVDISSSTGDGYTVNASSASGWSPFGVI